MTTLTPRQLDVLRLLAEGCAEQAIARRLGITCNTAHTHCSRMLQAIGARSRAHAVALAYERGLLGLEGDVVVAGKDQELAELDGKVVELHRQLDSARAWAVHFEQELESAKAYAVELEQEMANLRLRLVRAGCLDPDAEDDTIVRLVRDMGIVRDAEIRAVDRYAERAEVLSTLLRGMARRVGEKRRAHEVTRLLAAGMLHGRMRESGPWPRREAS